MGGCYNILGGRTDLNKENMYSLSFVWSSAVTGIDDAESVNPSPERLGWEH